MRIIQTARGSVLDWLFQWLSHCQRLSSGSVLFSTRIERLCPHCRQMTGFVFRLEQCLALSPGVVVAYHNVYAFFDTEAPVRSSQFQVPGNRAPWFLDHDFG